MSELRNRPEELSFYFNRKHPIDSVEGRFLKSISVVGTRQDLRFSFTDGTVLNIDRSPETEGVETVNVLTGANLSPVGNLTLLGTEENFQLGSVFSDIVLDSVVQGTGIFTGTVEGVLVFKPIVAGDNVVIEDNKVILPGGKSDRTVDSYTRVMPRSRIGGITSGAWRTMPIEMSTNNIPGVSIDSNRLTLPSGKYYIEASVQSYRTDWTKDRLYAIDPDPRVLMEGTSGYALSATGNTTEAYYGVSGYITLEVETELEFQRICTSSYGDFIFAVNPGVIEIWKVE